MTKREFKRYIRVFAKGINKHLLPWIVIGYVLLLVNVVFNILSSPILQ